MAINKRYPHVYDAEYVAGPLREVNLFTRSQSTSISYLDADGSTVVNRSKGFEDTNLTEDGRVNETGIILRTVGVRINAGPNQPDTFETYDELAFLERGYAELILNDNQVVFTARIRDLVPASAAVSTGFLQRSEGQPRAGATTVNNLGHMYPAKGIRIPRGVRFRLALKWDRPLTLPSGKTCRVEAELWGVSDEIEAEEKSRAGLMLPQMQAPAVSAVSVAVPGAR